MKKSNIDAIINKKCAPGRQYNDESCLQLKDLKKIAINYNKITNKNKININLPKQELVKKLEQNLSKQCSNQVCWIRLDFIKALNDNSIENAFRPDGPTEKYDWLSTVHINEVLEQYQYIHKDFLFLGAVPYDFEDITMLGLKNINFKELENNNKTKLGLVINLDEHYKRGSHWVSLYCDLQKYQIYFFDSVGNQPPKRIKQFINKIIKYYYKKIYNTNLQLNNIVEKLKLIEQMKYSKLQDLLDSNPQIDNIIKNIDYKYNNIQHQTGNSECGVYSINFIIRLLNKEKFNNIINKVTSDKQINKCRKIYFNNVNF